MSKNNSQNNAATVEQQATKAQIKAAEVAARRVEREAAWQWIMDQIALGTLPAGWETVDGCPVLPDRPRQYGIRVSNPYPTAKRSSLRRVGGDDASQIWQADEGMQGHDCGPVRDKEDEASFGDEANISLSETHWYDSAGYEEAVIAAEEQAVDQQFIKAYNFFAKHKKPRTPKVRAGEWRDPKVKVVSIGWNWTGKPYREGIAVNPKREIAKLRKAAAKKALEATNPAPVVVEVMETLVPEPTHKPVYHRAGSKCRTGLKVDDLVAAAVEANAKRVAKFHIPQPVAQLAPAEVVEELPPECIQELTVEAETPPPLPAMVAEEQRRAPTRKGPTLRKMTVAEWEAQQAAIEAEEAEKCRRAAAVA